MHEEVESQANPFVSVIIPAWNEEVEIGRAIRSAHCPFIAHEVIVVDAGSTDATARLAWESGGRVLHSDRRQRAAQMNLGATQARGEVFLFLHADTRLAPGALLAMREALRDPRVVGGAFARRFDSPSAFLAATCRLAEGRGRATGWNFGDQAIFARAHVFQRCGPFAEVDQFEDLDFSRKLAHCGRVVTLLPPVLASARRFMEDGPLVRTAKDLLLTCRYLWRGLAPAPLPPAMEATAFPPRQPRPVCP